MRISNQVKQNSSPKTDKDVLNSIKKRFSPRVYNNQAIPNSDLEIIFEAARLAPSGRNNQPWIYYWMKQGSAAWNKLFECIWERNWWAKSAPMMILTAYNPIEPTGDNNKWAQYDLGAANMSLILQAQDLGYYVRQIGSFDTEKAAKLFPEIEVPYIPFVCLAIGKMGSDNDYANANQEFVEKDLIGWERKVELVKEL